MIKNIVFDLGNVLVEFKPKDYMMRIGFEEEKAERLNAIIFKNPMWNEFDRGTITIEQYAKKLKEENPEYAEDIDKIFEAGWAAKLFRLVPVVVDFLNELSTTYKIYVLSNVSEYVLSYLKTLGFWQNVTSGTYSYILKACKPEKEIYESFFKDNNLKPEECFFLDDKPENIEAARKMRMDGIIFTGDIAAVKAQLKNK